MPESAAEAIDAPAADMADDTEMGDSETAAEPWRPRHNRNEPRGPDYKPFTVQIRRGHRRGASVRSRRTRPAARLSRQAALAPARRGRAARQSPAAASAGAAKPRLGIRSGRGLARSGAAAARDRRSAASAVVQAREGHRLPRHGGHAAARQFRLDARAPDHGRRDLRRHSGAHARTLRRKGRDFGLHHARLEGRPVARKLARAGQAGQSGAAQRSAPHHLQVCRRALAARAQESRSDDARGLAQGEYRRRGARLGAQTAAWPAGKPQDPDDDLRRRAGRRLRPCRSIPAIISSATCAG